MSVHLSEDEQLEALKRWWKDYGKTVLLSIVVALGIYFGWNAWQAQQLAKREAASATYEELLKVVTVEPGQTLQDKDKATAEHLAKQLKEGDSSSLYAHNAAFFLANIAVTAGDYDTAASEINWILQNEPDSATKQLANLRLAKVLFAKGSYDEALALVQTPPKAGFTADYSEVYGDILKAKGDLDAARTAYAKALADTAPQQQERQMLLQMKLGDLKESMDTASIESEVVPETVE